jgi:predicted nucleic acid-binding protein
VSAGLLLVDKSAYVRGAAVSDLEGELCICAVTRLELLYSARSGRHYAELEKDISAFRDLRMDAETWAIALTASCELAARASHRIPIPDLLVAACAQRRGVGVVHVGRHFDALTEVLSFEAVRLA